MDNERRKPSNAALRRVVVAGYCMEFELDQLLEKGPGYVLTERDCERMALMQRSWAEKMNQLRKETESPIVRLADAAESIR